MTANRQLIRDHSSSCKATDCEKPIPEQRLGRPRDYCSHDCKERQKKRNQREQTAMKKRKRGLSQVAARVQATWSDLERRARWYVAIQRFDPVIRRTLRAFEAWGELPPEMAGESYRVVGLDPGDDVEIEGEEGNELVAESPLVGYAWEAIADLTWSLEVDKISEAMVVNRVRQYIIDQIRRLDGFGQPRIKETTRVEEVRITRPDGSRVTISARTETRETRPTRKLQPSKSEFVHNDRPDPAGDRASREVDLATFFREASLAECFAGFFAQAVKDPERVIAGFIELGMREAEDWFVADLWRAFGIGDEGDWIAAFEKFDQAYRISAWRGEDPTEAIRAVAEAFARWAEGAELYGNGPEPFPEEEGHEAALARALG